MDWTSHGTMVALIAGFAGAHSGLAYLRPWGEARWGARLYRVGFALVSIPLAVLLIIFFLNHRYDGILLWQVQDLPGIHSLVWLLSLISFLFLYPATFNLLEIAAIQKPDIYLYTTGVIRITRHPQMVGQVIWCLAHTLWVGSSFMVVASLGLIAYHLFAVWHGDLRWQRRYGEAFEQVKAQTSVIPFRAILDGRQPWKPQEFLRWSYVGVLGATALFYWVHPQVMALAQGVRW